MAVTFEKKCILLVEFPPDIFLEPYLYSFGKAPGSYTLRFLVAADQKGALAEGNARQILVRILIFGWQTVLLVNDSNCGHILL